jgi:hypothetical protein
MGGGLFDYLVEDVRGQLNKRFGPGDPIVEMAALQQEFQVFSRRHPLRRSSAVLDIGPSDTSQREKWYDYLDHLKTYESDAPGQDGHNRIRNALIQNLRQKKPLPVYFALHASAVGGEKVLVYMNQPVVFTRLIYLVVSVPMVPTQVSRPVIASAARTRRKRRQLKQN